MKRENYYSILKEKEKDVILLRFARDKKNLFSEFATATFNHVLCKEVFPDHDDEEIYRPVNVGFNSSKRF